MDDLKNILAQLTTGDRSTIRDAKKKLRVWQHSARSHSKETRCAIEDAYFPLMRNFATMDSAHQAAFVESLWVPFLVLGEERFDLFVEFILMAVQHPLGNIRHAAVRVADWLIMSLIPLFEKEEHNTEGRLHVQKSQERFAAFVFAVERLLEQYAEPRFQRYHYISRIPSSVYKSLQQLMTEALLRSPEYEKLYAELLKKSVRQSPLFWHEQGAPSQEQHLPEEGFLVPRELQEMISYFEHLLFGTFPEAEKERHNASAPFFTRQDLVRLYDEGILERIFRRWVQTNWSWRQWTSRIQGETPRQELGISYPGIQDGTAVIRLRVDDSAKDLTIVPDLIDVGEGNTLFLSSVQEEEQSIALHLRRVQRDPDFPSFLSQLRKLAVLSPRADDPYTSWRLFWKSAASRLLETLPLTCAMSERGRLAEELQLHLDAIVRAEGPHLDDFIFFDGIFYTLWEALRPREHLPSIDWLQDHLVETRKEKGLTGAKRMMFFLGKMIDKTILFPAEQYFGAVESVWTDQMNFMTDFHTTISVWKERCPPTKEAANDPLLAQTLAPRELCFSPCTAFRVLGKFREALQ